MKTLGIVGGIGPESTIDYYRSLIAAWQRAKQDGSYPRIIIHSVEAQSLMGLFAAGDWTRAAETLIAAVRSVASAGADVALIAANTPHMVFAEVSGAASIPMISIVEETCRAARSHGVQRPALFGTRYTMQASFYPDAFGRDGMTIVLPSPEEQELIHDIYFNELVRGVFLDESRAKLESIVAAMKERDAIDALILGGTELPLLLGESSYSGVRVLDTTRIHVDAAIRALLA